LVRRILVISKVTWTSFICRAWYWPHILITLFFIYQIKEKGDDFQNLMAALDFSIMLTLLLMLFLALNEGREELSRKTIIRLRTLPLSWFEECSGSALALLSYGVSLMLPLVIVVFFLSVNQESLVNIVKWDQHFNLATLSSGQWTIKAPKALSKNERLAVEVTFYEDNMVSHQSVAKLPLEIENKREEILMKSKRVNPMPNMISMVKLPEVFSNRGVKLRLVIEKIYVLEERKSLGWAWFHGCISMCLQGLLLAYLFVLLGRKVSIEVGVFFILGCLLIQSAYALLGDELLQDAMSRMSIARDSSRGIKMMWWEPYLFEWTKVLAKFDDIRSFFQTHSIMDEVKAERWIMFPFKNIQFIKEMLVSGIMLGIVAMILKPRET